MGRRPVFAWSARIELMTVAALAALPEGSELVVAIEKARALLVAGDVHTALLLSAGAYEQARAGVTYARRVKASQRLVGKARALQAEALKIENLCLVAMADAVDEAQSTGEVAKPGRPSKGAEAPPSFEKVGIEKRFLHHARRVRSAVRLDPDFIERTIDARLASGGEPSRAFVRDRAIESVGGRKVRQVEHVLVTGCALEKVHWYELDGLIRDLRRDLSILESIKAHCVPSDDSIQLKEIFGPGGLGRFLGGVDG